MGGNFIMRLISSSEEDWSISVKIVQKRTNRMFETLTLLLIRRRSLEENFAWENLKKLAGTFEFS